MIFSRAMRPPTASAETQTLSWDAVQELYRTGFLSGEEQGSGISHAEHLSPVAAAHRILSNSFGLVPFGTYQKDGDSRQAVHDKDLDYVLKVRPNVDMTPHMCSKTVMSNAFWHGVGYCWNVRDDKGRLTARVPLPSECCTVRRDRERGVYWYDFNVDGTFRTFSPYELSMLFFESYDGVRGRGILDLARETVAADGMAQRYAKKFYQNGARISGIVEVDTDADKETRTKVKNEFRAFAGQDAFLVAVLDHSMKYTPLGLNQKDAQFIESRNFSVEETARYTGIPKYMLQVGKEAYNSNAQQRIDYVTDTLLPYVSQWEQENTYKLLVRRQREAGWYVHGTVEVLLRADPKTRAEFYEKMIQNSVYCPDDCRAKEEKNPIPGGLGQRFLASKNLGSLEHILSDEQRGVE